MAVKTALNHNCKLLNYSFPSFTALRALSPEMKLRQVSLLTNTSASPSLYYGASSFSHPRGAIRLFGCDWPEKGSEQDFVWMFSNFSPESLILSLSTRKALGLELRSTCHLRPLFHGIWLAVWWLANEWPIVDCCREYSWDVPVLCICCTHL